MQKHQDAYGQELYAVYQGDHQYEIIERDDGYFDALDPSAYFTTYDQWSKLQQQAMKHVKGRVLDIGCAVGRHSLYLQEQGHDVLGIDVSPLAIKVCKLRGLKKARAIPITQISRNKLGTFDSIIMLGNNLGLLGNKKRAKWLLKRFYNLTSDNGIIIGETLDPYQTKEPVHLAYHKRNKKRGKMGGQARIRVRHKTSVTPWMDYLFVSKSELEDLLTNTGWKIQQHINTKSASYISIITKL